MAGLRGHEGPVLAVAVSPDGRWAASGGIDGAINLWQIDERRVVASLHGHGAPVWALAFTPDGRRLLSAGAAAVTRVWDLESRSETGASGELADTAEPAPGGAAASRGDSEAHLMWKEGVS